MECIEESRPKTLIPLLFPLIHLLGHLMLLMLLRALKSYFLDQQTDFQKKSFEYYVIIYIIKLQPGNISN